MVFQFESDDFKFLFKKIENICLEIINSPQEYDAENVDLANAINTAGHVLNTNLDLSVYDKLIISTRDMPVFDFINEIARTLEEYKKSPDGDVMGLNNLLRHTAVLIYAYFYELNLRSKNLKNDLSMYIGQFNNSIEKIVLVDTPYYMHINHVKNYLMFSMIKDMLDVSGIQELNNLNNKILEAKATLDQWDEKLLHRENAVNEIELKLKNVKQQYDFVLLNKGFKDLYNQKLEQFNNTRDSYSKFVGMLVATPFVVLIIIFLLVAFADNLFKYAVYAIPPVTTFLILLFYFTRVIFQDKRALQSQMMQIELRMALCQFIQSYAEETESLHKKNAAGFEKFETLIFSPIVSSDDNIPSTIDGVDQLVRLIEAARR